jgi:hypothetical protein
MNDAEYWEKQIVEVCKQYFYLREILNEIVIAPSDKEPFNNIEWYKNVAKRALEESSLNEYRILSRQMVSR